MFPFWEKLRKEAFDEYNGRYNRNATWRQAILEAVFNPHIILPEGKGPMTHLHPDIKKLHLPPGIYISDWRKYRVEDHPALVNYQKRCHAAGLHDPWIRNYCWNFYPSNMGCRSRFAVIVYQITWGFTAASVIFAIQRTYTYLYPPKYMHSQEYRDKYGDVEITPH